MKELKACPFCGKDGKLFTWTIPNKEPLYQACCVNAECLIRPETEYCLSREEVIIAWNGRRNRIARMGGEEKCG